MSTSRRLAALVAAVALCALGAVERAHAVDLYDCDDFSSQSQAQAVLRADPTDPHHLDGPDDDGIACDDNAPPLDLNPVPGAVGDGTTTSTVRRATTTTVVAAQPTTTSTTTPMAQTGPAETATMVGLGLLVIGAGFAMRGRRADGRHFA